MQPDFQRTFPIRPGHPQLWYSCPWPRLSFQHLPGDYGPTYLFEPSAKPQCCTAWPWVAAAVCCQKKGPANNGTIVDVGGQIGKVGSQNRDRAMPFIPKLPRCRLFPVGARMAGQQRCEWSL